MKTVIFAGMPKTGTTTLQTFLHSKRSALLERGVVYPVCGRFSESTPNHHAFFCSYLNGEPPFGSPISTPSLPPSLYAHLIKTEAEACAAKRIILSSEFLFDPLFSPNILRRVHHDLNFSETNVIIVLREEWDFLESLYAQRVCGPQKISDRFDQHIAWLQQKEVLLYDKRIEEFKDAFGKDQVDVVWYHDVKKDLFAILDQHLPGQLPQPRTDQKELNTRRTWFFVACQRRVNQLPSGHTKIKTKLTQFAQFFEKLCSKLSLAKTLDAWFYPFKTAELEKYRERFN